MQYLSTRGHPERKRFCDILLEGLAPDGGLYLPETYPQIGDAELTALRQAYNEEGYAALAFRILSLYIDDKVLAITNKYAPRKGLIPEISAQSGLVGYPTFDGIGVNFQTLFNPAITFGGSVKLTTDVKAAEGEWIVVSVAHRLESEKPGGAWFSTVRGNVNGLAVIR